jgi:hypothetical protein
MVVSEKRAVAWQPLIPATHADDGFFHSRRRACISELRHSNPKSRLLPRPRVCGVSGDTRHRTLVVKPCELPIRNARSLLDYITAIKLTDRSRLGVSGRWSD